MSCPAAEAMAFHSGGVLYVADEDDWARSKGGVGLVTRRGQVRDSFAEAVGLHDAHWKGGHWIPERSALAGRSSSNQARFGG